MRPSRQWHAACCQFKCENLFPTQFAASKQHAQMMQTHTLSLSLSPNYPWLRSNLRRAHAIYTIGNLRDRCGPHTRSAFSPSRQSVRIQLPLCARVHRRNSAKHAQLRALKLESLSLFNFATRPSHRLPIQSLTMGGNSHAQPLFSSQ